MAKPNKTPPPVLDSDRTRASAITSHASVYLTLQSIIQGLALGTLFSTLVTLLETQRWLHFWSLGLTGFLLVSHVWFSYLTKSIVYSWQPRWIDSALPFALGLVELAAISSYKAGTRDVLWAFCAISLLSAAEHGHSLVRVRIGGRRPGDEPLYTFQVSLKRRRIIEFTVWAIILASSAAVSEIEFQGREYLILMPTLALVYVTTTMDRAWRGQLRLPREDPSEGVQRRAVKDRRNRRPRGSRRASLRPALATKSRRRGKGVER